MSMVRKKLSWKQILLGGGLVILFLINLTFYIWYQSESVRLGYQIHEMELKVEQLKEEIKKLETRKAALLSPERIDRLARENLNLTDPKPEQVIFENLIEK